MSALRRNALLALLCLCLPAGAYAIEPLPTALTLEYDVSRNGHGIGAVTRTLKRAPDGRYAHTLWMRATGLTSLVYRTEWREDGEFVVIGKDVLPQRFTETRAGDKRAYEHRVTFDQAMSQLTFGKNPPQPLPRGLQDQGSIVYALMLDPLLQPGERFLPQTNGKEIETYRFSYRGKEKLSTPFGEREAIVIRRISQKRLEREQACRAQNLKEPDCTQPDDFTFWLLPEKRYVPAKLERRRKDETTTMLLREARGL